MAATLVLLLVGLVAAVYEAWQVAVIATALLVAASIVFSLESGLRQGAHTFLLREIQQSLTDIRSALAESVAAHERTREEILSARKEASERLSHVQDEILSDIKDVRKLDGERHARSRKLLSEIAQIGSETREQAAQSLSAAAIRERRVLGVVEAERLRSDDRHRELIMRWEGGTPHRDDGSF